MRWKTSWKPLSTSSSWSVSPFYSNPRFTSRLGTEEKASIRWYTALHYTLVHLSLALFTWLRSRYLPLLAQFDLYFGVVDDATVSEHFKRLGWILRTPEVALYRYVPSLYSLLLCYTWYVLVYKCVDKQAF